jgi:hypothetical protein
MLRGIHPSLSPLSQLGPKNHFTSLIKEETFEKRSTKLHGAADDCGKPELSAEGI